MATIIEEIYGEKLHTFCSVINLAEPFFLQSQNLHHSNLNPFQPHLSCTVSQMAGF